MNSTTTANSSAMGTEVAPLAQNTVSMRDKLDELRFTMVIVLTQLLFRTALLLRRWNY
ncbi:MAG TPA: hypothetical protein VJR26_10035 [Candidatus Acidoferrales bacterium]|nr:hypothetical protein [Candidatus Acidoferrales bacterium]